jgi:hypothetical protein
MMIMMMMMTTIIILIIIIIITVWSSGLCLTFRSPVNFMIHVQVFNSMHL